MFKARPHGVDLMVLIYLLRKWLMGERDTVQLSASKLEGMSSHFRHHG